MKGGWLLVLYTGTQNQSHARCSNSLVARVLNAAFFCWPISKNQSKTYLLCDMRFGLQIAGDKLSALYTEIKEQYGYWQEPAVDFDMKPYFKLNIFIQSIADYVNVISN